MLRLRKFMLIELLAVGVGGHCVRTSAPQFSIDLSWRMAQKLTDPPKRNTPRCTAKITLRSSLTGALYRLSIEHPMPLGQWVMRLMSECKQYQSIHMLVGVLITIVCTTEDCNTCSQESRRR